MADQSATRHATPRHATARRSTTGRGKARPGTANAETTSRPWIGVLGGASALPHSRQDLGDSATQTSQARPTDRELLQLFIESGVPEIVSGPCAITDSWQWLAAQAAREQRLRWIRASHGWATWPEAAAWPKACANGFQSSNFAQESRAPD